MQSIDDPGTPILVVDDNVQYSQVLVRILKSGLGYTDVTLVSSPGEAYTLISENPGRFRILFVDYNFPNGETGGELLNRLKGADFLRDKVAFLITSDPTVDNMKEALRAGALGVVAKPFDRAELKAQLEKAKRSIGTEEGESF